MESFQSFTLKVNATVENTNNWNLCSKTYHSLSVWRKIWRIRLWNLMHNFHIFRFLGFDLFDDSLVSYKTVGISCGQWFLRGWNSELTGSLRPRSLLIGLPFWGKSKSNGVLSSLRENKRNTNGSLNWLSPGQKYPFLHLPKWMFCF